jgi:hypothetical protein
MKNLLLEKVEYQIEETPRGIWRRFVYPSGDYYAEYCSNTLIFGLPLLHYTRGKCPETGKRKVARGFIAVGRMAVGVIAVGQASAGIIAFGQAGIGLLFCLAQAGAGMAAIGQLALGIAFGAGQLATGITAIGQMAAGRYVLAQFGFGQHLWTTDHCDPTAVQHFQDLWALLRSHFPGAQMR